MESHDTLRSLEEVYIRKGNDTKGPFTLKNILVRKNTFLVDMEGVEDIEKARAFVGCQVLKSSQKTVTFLVQLRLFFPRGVTMCMSVAEEKGRFCFPVLPR